METRTRINGACTAPRWPRSRPSTCTVPGRPDSSVMDWFAARGYDTWCMDNEGYGRSDKPRPINSDIANGADDLDVGSTTSSRRPARKAPDLRHLVGRAEGGALRPAPSRARRAPRARRVRLDRRRAARRSPSGASACPSSSRRTAGRSTARSCAASSPATIPGTADEATIDAFADAILALDDSVPTGTYVDMCSKLPLVDPAKITVPTIVMRGQYDGIAGFDDLLEFFKRLPNPDKQFAVMAGISHASFQQKNYRIVYHILHSFFTQARAGLSADETSPPSRLSSLRARFALAAAWRSAWPGRTAGAHRRAALARADSPTCPRGCSRRGFRPARPAGVRREQARRRRDHRRGLRRRRRGPTATRCSSPARRT